MSDRQLRLILVGPPGVGKGTQGRLLSRRFSIPEIATGDIFRNAMKERTTMGLAAKPYLDSGNLVPDAVTIGLIEERLKASDAATGFILDGFPRTAQQATALDALVHKSGKKLNAVLEIKVGGEELVRRLTGRRLCAVCQTPYHLQSAPTKTAGVCDRCGGPLVSRSDDDEATVLTRLAEYERKTAPLAEYYRAAGLLKEIDGNASVEQVFQRVLAAVGEPQEPAA